MRFVPAMICIIIFTWLKGYGQSPAHARYSDEPVFVEGTGVFKHMVQDLEKKFQLRFAYDSKLSPQNIVSNFNQEHSISACLKEIFFLSNLEYQLSDSLVLIRSRGENQLKASLRGRILDAGSNEAIGFVLVNVKDHTTVLSDSLGFFEVPLPHRASPDSLEFSCLGYQRKKIPWPKVHDPLIIRMQFFPVPIPVIRVTSKPLQSDALHMEKLSEMSTLSLSSMIVGKDVLRSIQLLPGISASNDLSAKLLIRGSESYETQINLDGMTLYNPTHFYNIFSSINPDYVDQVDIYKNYIPIDEPSYTGGLVSMQSVKADPAKAAAGLDIDLLNASGHILFPIAPQTGLSLAGRTSYRNVGNSQFFNILRDNRQQSVNEATGDLIQNLTPDFSYYDLNASLQSQFPAGITQKINFYLSDDRLSQMYQETKTPSDKLPLYYFNYSDQTQWDNLALSSDHGWNYTEAHSGRLQFQYSVSGFEEHFSFVNLIEKPQGQSRFRISNDMQNEIRDFHLTFANSWDLKGPSEWKYGVELGRYSTQTAIQIDSTSILDLSGQEIPFTVFQEYRSGFGSFSYRIGTRISWLNKQNILVADPRLSLQYHAKGSGFTLLTSLSYNHQFISQLSYENHLGQNFDFWVLADETFPLLRSFNTMIGGKKEAGTWKFSAEFYTKWRMGLTEFAILKPGLSYQGNSADEFRLFTGDGRILGLDLLVGKQIGDFSTQVNYTISSNMVRFPGIFRGEYYPDNDHRLHQLKWLNMYRWHSSVFNINTIYSSGRPFLDVSRLEKQVPRSELDPETQIGYLPYYLRIDVGFSHEFHISSKKLTLGISIFNLLDRKNLYNVQYIKPIKSDKPGVVEYLAAGANTQLLGRTLNLSLSLDLFSARN